MASVLFFKNGMKGKGFPSNPKLLRSGLASTCICESTPVVFNEKRLLTAVGSPFNPQGPFTELCISVIDPNSGQVLSKFAEGYGFASTIVHDSTMHVFTAKTDLHSNGANKIESFSSDDLKTWRRADILHAGPDELLFNTSVCNDGQRFIMAYEVQDKKTVPFTIYFAESSDLQNWTRLSGPVFGEDRYTACPALRYVDGWYYMFYLEHRKPRWWFEMCISRSKDFVTWEHSKRGPVLQPEAAELCNTSDLDLVEYEGKTYVYYAYGNQTGMGCDTWAEYDGPMSDFLQWYFTT